jgi:hypothetical protein
MNRFLLGMVILLICCDVLADSFRCGRALVKVGESSNALMKKCGHPLTKFSSRETINDHGRMVKVGVSNWVYERNGKKDMIVSVHSGAVIKIEVD